MEKKQGEFWVLIIDHEGKPISEDRKRECFDYEPENDGKEVLLHVIDKVKYDKAIQALKVAHEALDNLALNNGEPIGFDCCELTPNEYAHHFMNMICETLTELGEMV